MNFKTLYLRSNSTSARSDRAQTICELKSATKKFRHLSTRISHMLRFLQPGILTLFLSFAANRLVEGQHTGSSGRVMTWVPPYGIGDSRTRLDESFDGISMRDGLTHLGLQFWNPTKDGGIELVTRFKDVNETEISNFREWGHAHGVRVMLCLYNGTSSGWDWELARSAFGTHQKDLVEALVRETLRLKLDGVDIDLEGKGDLEESKDSFVNFIRDLSSRLHSEGKELSVNTFAHKWHAPRRSWWPELLPHINGLNVMGYSETGANSDEWRSYGSFKAAAGIHHSKLLIGMPSNTARWQESSVIEHLNWVIEDASVGLAIWDARLRNLKWRSKETWLAISEIKGGAEPYGGDQPANGPESQPEGNDKLEPKAEVRLH